MLIDAVLPRFEFIERHQRVVACTPDALWKALAVLRPSDLPIASLFMALRALPLRLTGARLPADRGDGSLLATLRWIGFVPLAGAIGEELVYGLAGRFWRLGEAPVPIASPDDFARAAERGLAIAVVSLAVRPNGPGASLIVTETRVHVGEAGRAAFGRYWRWIRPWSGLLRRELLRALARRGAAMAR